MPKPCFQLLCLLCWCSLFEKCNGGICKDTDELPICSTFKNPVYSTGSVSVYHGDSVSVSTLLNVSHLTGTPVVQVYVNGCGFTDCSFSLSPANGLYTVQCNIRNILNYTEVYLVLFESTEFICFNSSWITIKGPPPHVQVKSITVTCDEVEVVLNETALNNDTTLSYVLRDEFTDDVVCMVNGTNESTIILPAELFTNRLTLYNSSRFSLTIIPVNPSGEGTSTSIWIPTHYAVKSIVKNVSLFAKGRDVAAVGMLEVFIADGCLFVPNHIVLDGNCSTNGRPAIYSIEKQQYSAIPLTIESIRRMKENTSCTISVKVNGSVIGDFTINGSTMIVQDFRQNLIRNNLMFECHLLPGSVDTGCVIHVNSTDTSNGYYKQLTLSRGDETINVVSGKIELPTVTRPYNVTVFNSWNYGEYGNETEVFHKKIFYEGDGTHSVTPDDGGMSIVLMAIIASVCIVLVVLCITLIAIAALYFFTRNRTHNPVAGSLQLNTIVSITERDPDNVSVHSEYLTVGVPEENNRNYEPDENQNLLNPQPIKSRYKLKKPSHLTVVLNPIPGHHSLQETDHYLPQQPMIGSPLSVVTPPTPVVVNNNSPRFVFSPITTVIQNMPIATVTTVITGTTTPVIYTQLQEEQDHGNYTNNSGGIENTTTT